MNTTEYKGYNVLLQDSRYYVCYIGGGFASGFNLDGYATMNNAKGAITKAEKAAQTPENEFVKSVINLKSQPATGDDKALASVPAEQIVAEVYEAAFKRHSVQKVLGWTTQQNLNGNPIHADPETAHTYALLDYHNMTRERDNRSRNKREGLYNGHTNGHPERVSQRNGGTRTLFSRTSAYYAPTRKARKAAKLNARKGA